LRSAYIAFDDLFAYVTSKFRNYKIIYRRYAGLFFCVCVDANDNELAYLEAIHLFVEVLGMVLSLAAVFISTHVFDPDSFFENVCELDLVFNFYKVLEFHSRHVSLIV
jgi:Clathrin adaptor complex small chain